MGSVGSFSVKKFGVPPRPWRPVCHCMKSNGREYQKVRYETVFGMVGSAAERKSRSL